MDEVSRLKARYAAQVEDGKKIEAFTSLPEWQWYIEHVIKSTIETYIQRIMTGEILSDKEDWVIRGMVMGMKLVTETPETLKQNAKEARKKSQALREAIENDT